jgi:hypothetical protein
MNIDEYASSMNKTLKIEKELIKYQGKSFEYWNVVFIAKY